MISSFIQQSGSGSLIETVARGTASLPRESYRVWDDAIRLDNRDAEAVVVPSCGRILRYGPSGEENFLWEKLKISPISVPSRGRSVHSGKAIAPNNHQDVGGAFALPWPQSRWSEGFAEAQKSHELAHELEVINRRTVAIETALPDDFGFALRREIAQAPHGERVTIQSSLHPTQSIRSTRKTRRTNSPLSLWSPWLISEIRMPTRLAVRINPRTDLPGGFKLISREPWETVREVGGDILLATCPQSRDAGFGCDGDLVVAEIGHYLFMQRRVSEDGATGRHLPGEAVQISCSKSSDQETGHASIEFTGRRGQAAPTLTVEWDFMPWNPTNTDNELAALVRSL